MLKESVHFDERADIDTKDITGIQEIFEDLSVKSLENFGEPTHIVDFGNDEYAIFALRDMGIKTCVYNGEVRAAITIDKATAFGVRVMK